MANLEHPTLRNAAQHVTSPVMVVEADRRIGQKLGVSYGQLVDPIIIKAAEEVIRDYAPRFKDEVFGALSILREAVEELQPGPLDPARIEKIRDKAFMIKSYARFCGYDLAMTMAGLFDGYCDKLIKNEKEITFGTLDVLRRFVRAISSIFKQDIKNPQNAIEVIGVLDELRKSEPVPPRPAAKSQTPGAPVMH